MPENHYTRLGIEPSAPPATVQSAIDRLADEANRLAFTSPQQSRELWSEIRQIRDDLLTGSVRRHAYDESLRATQAASIATLERPRPVPTAAPTPTLEPVSRPRVAHPIPAPGATRSPIWPLLAAAAIVALTLGLALALQHEPSSRTPKSKRPVVAHRATAVPARARARAKPTAVPRPVQPAGLSTGGFRRGTSFISGRRIVLHWQPLPHGSVYRVQVTGASDPGFEHPIVSALVSGTQYSLKLPGQRTYLWHVQSMTSGIWTRFSRSASFLVDRPRVPAPHPEGVVAAAGPTVRLCWSAVPWATAYQLEIHAVTGDTQMIIHGTCQTVTETPGTYSWTVAAVVWGVQRYLGPSSPPRRLIIPAARSSAALVPASPSRKVRGSRRARRSRPAAPAHTSAPLVAAVTTTTSTSVSSPPAHGTVPSSPAVPAHQGSKPGAHTIRHSAAGARRRAVRPVTVKPSHTAHTRTSIPPPPPPPPVPAGARSPSSTTSVTSSIPPPPTAVPYTVPSYSAPPVGYATPVTRQYYSPSSRSTSAVAPTSPPVYYVAPTAVPPPTYATPPTYRPPPAAQAPAPSYSAPPRAGENDGGKESAPGRTCPGKEEHPGCGRGQEHGHGKP